MLVGEVLAVLLAGVLVGGNGAGEFHALGMRLALDRAVQSLGVARKNVRDAGGVFLRVGSEEIGLKMTLCG